MSFRPVDHEARARARSDFTTSLVVEAGAGTGKTTLLVDRMEALVCSGTALLPEIAAVTFTENAATTMKLRLRERLERARVGDLPAPARARAAEALDVATRRWWTLSTAASRSRAWVPTTSAAPCGAWRAPFSTSGTWSPWPRRWRSIREPGGRSCS